MLLYAGNVEALSEFDTPSLHHLAGMGLVGLALVEGGGIEDVTLTTMGKEYIKGNPRLYNPVDWKWLVITALLAVTAIAAVAALFISCTK